MSVLPRLSAAALPTAVNPSEVPSRSWEITPTMLWNIPVTPALIPSVERNPLRPPAAAVPPAAASPNPPATSAAPFAAAAPSPESFPSRPPIAVAPAEAPFATTSAAAMVPRSLPIDSSRSGSILLIASAILLSAGPSALKKSIVISTSPLKKLTNPAPNPSATGASAFTMSLIPVARLLKMSGVIPDTVVLRFSRAVMSGDSFVSSSPFSISMSPCRASVRSPTVSSTIPFQSNPVRKSLKAFVICAGSVFHGISCMKLLKVLSSALRVPLMVEPKSFQLNPSKNPMMASAMAFPTASQSTPLTNPSMVSIRELSVPERLWPNSFQSMFLTAMERLFPILHPNCHQLNVVMKL